MCLAICQHLCKLTQSWGKLRARVTNLGRSQGHRMIACPACHLRIGVTHTNLGKQAAFGHFLSMRSSHHRSSSRQMDTNYEYNVRDRVGGSLAMRDSQRKDLKGKDHVVSGKSCEGCCFLSSSSSGVFSIPLTAPRNILFCPCERMSLRRRVVETLVSAMY